MAARGYDNSPKFFFIQLHLILQKVAENACHVVLLTALVYS